MEIKEVVALLLFVLPGILTEKISYKFDFPSAEKRSEFREVIRGLLLSLPIILISLIVLKNVYGFKTLDSIMNSFNDLCFLIDFSILLTIVAIIIGVVKGLFGDDIAHLIVNKVRSIFKKMDIDDKSCWRNAFLDNNVPRYVKIFKDGVLMDEGFVEYYSLPNEEMSIVLERPEYIDYYLENNPEFKNYLKHFRTYINIEKGVIVKIYDTKEVYNYLNSLNKNAE